MTEQIYWVGNLAYRIRKAVTSETCLPWLDDVYVYFTDHEKAAYDNDELSQSELEDLLHKYADISQYVTYRVSLNGKFVDSRLTMQNAKEACREHAFKLRNPGVYHV